MKRIERQLAAAGLMTCLVLLSTLLASAQTGEASPVYKKAAYAGETVTIENDQIRINMFKRVGGWGWGEIHAASGKMMGVLEHLGEIMLRDQDIPVRCVAESYERKTTDQGESLVFQVKSVVARNILEGTSFDNWMVYTFLEPPLVGEVTITVDSHKPIIYLSYHLKATGNYYARYIRGPWLKVGEGSFGIAKEDAIVPGVDWSVKDEWSSGTDWFKDPWAKLYVPHPNKLTMPLMAIAHDGTGIGIAWNPHQVATRWFNYRSHVPQPVFATPNFIDRMNNQLMGLMVPDATIEGHENEIYAEIPLETKIDQEINFDAEIWISQGNSMDVVMDWIGRHGLPDPGPPRWSYEETLEKIANAYNTNLWHEGEGFGYKQGRYRSIRPSVPDFLERWVEENKKSPLAKELRVKLDWSREQMEKSGRKRPAAPDREGLIRQGEELLEIQKPDGTFRFDPKGRHWRKDDFMVATSFIEPMGLAGDSALEIEILPATQLLDIANKTGEERFADAARKAFEFCLHMTRPEAGDNWECPLHAANLFAAGHAAIGYYEAYRKWGDQRYLDKSIYWIRTILPFTHLWETDQVRMMYNTKPVFSSSDWYFANWVRDHVQWEVLSVFLESVQRGIYWGDIDPEVDWDRFHEGITTAVIRWMIVHTDNTWRPHNIPSTYEGYKRGDYDYTWPDTHNSTTGNYGGMFISPAAIANNIYAIFDRRKMQR
jgi:hypothetical protein